MYDELKYILISLGCVARNVSEAVPQAAHWPEYRPAISTKRNVYLGPDTCIPAAIVLRGKVNESE